MEPPLPDPNYTAQYSPSPVPTLPDTGIGVSGWFGLGCLLILIGILIFALLKHNK